MDKLKFNFEDVLIKSSYFQECLENLMCLLQPSFYCVKLVVKVIIHGPDGCGKRMLARTAAKNLNMSFHEIRVSDLFDENIVGTEKKVKAAFNKPELSSPSFIYWSGYEILQRLEEPDLDRIIHCITESIEELTTNDKCQPIVFIASTDDFSKIKSSPLSTMFHYDVAVKPANKDQAQELVTLLIEGAEIKSNNCDIISNCDIGDYFLGNLIDFIARNQIDEQFRSETDERTDLSDTGVHWSDIGGLSSIKKEVIDTIQLSLRYPQLQKAGLRRTGILLYGPPGTGKTLIAKAIATESNLNFIGIKGPELLNEYVGQSENNIRNLFCKARETSPSIIFFDEIDSLAPNRGQAGDSGGVMDRMVSQLLAEMDGIQESEVFVIGATNRKDLVDPSLLRPGRFDKVLEVPPPKDKESRLQILKALVKNMKLSNDVDLDRLESLLPENVSGADIQGFCSKAMQKTIDRCAELVDAGKADEEGVEIITRMDDFLASIQD